MTEINNISISSFGSTPTNNGRETVTDKDDKPVLAKSGRETVTDKDDKPILANKSGVASIFNGATTKEQIREKLLLAVSNLTEKCEKDSELKNICNSLHKLLLNKGDSAESLIKIQNDLKEVFLQGVESTKSLSNEIKNAKSIDELETASKKSNTVFEKLRLVSTLLPLIYPLTQKHLATSSKNILQLSESGTKRYPEKHSFFASTVQESEAPPGVSKFIADKVNNGSSIENAFLKSESEYHGNGVLPQALTHRLSTDSTKDKNVNFEVLFIHGDANTVKEQEQFAKNEKVLTKAINETSNNHCKQISSLTTPTFEELENKLKEISTRLKENNIGKLYIVYNGHGGSDGLQEGVSVENSKKQGAERFLFGLNKNNNLTEEQIKELYNKYLKDIEAVTIFDSCHSGAGITAIENDKLKSQLNALA
ncbi:MAG: caspase family protein [Candidatus Melainabacteria bacterium]|nr:caspase family protein [Candidatus Melainabacteria bacterium]